MKTQQECWQALIDGETLVRCESGIEYKMVDGRVDGPHGPHGPVSFANASLWSIKPKKLPFVEALRALVNGECREIRKENGAQIAGHDCFDELLPSDFDHEWELIK